VLTVVAVDANNLLTHLHVDRRKRAIAALCADALNAGLVLVEVNV